MTSREKEGGKEGERKRSREGGKERGREGGKELRDLLVSLFTAKICKIIDDDHFCCTCHYF